MTFGDAIGLGLAIGGAVLAIGAALAWFIILPVIGLLHVCGAI